jgi:hypothetical protein
MRHSKKKKNIRKFNNKKNRKFATATTKVNAPTATKRRRRSLAIASSYWHGHIEHSKK